MKELDDGEWIEVYESPAEGSTQWAPIQEEGAKLFVQTGQGKFLKYVYENGHYTLVGEVVNG